MAYRVLGIDPGISPAGAFLSSAPKENCAFRIERTSRFAFNVHKLRKYIKTLKPDVVFVETMSPIAGQGISSTAALMTAWGMIQGVCVGCRVPCELVQPAAWKEAIFNEHELGRYISDAAARKKHQKAAAVARVHREYPMIKLVKKGCRSPDHNMAEAVLIAAYGATLVNV